MITITRRLAGQLRVIFRKALNITRGTEPALHFATGPDGIRVRARSKDAAVEYHVPGKLPPDEIWIPPEFLSDVEARRDDPIQMEMLGDGQVLAGWRAGNVPQMVQYEPVPTSSKIEFPGRSKKFAENPARLLTALHETMQTTDQASARYALSCVQVRGASGTIVGTDGRQVLQHRGFTFPWKDELLFPASKVFACKELPQNEPVAIGKTGDWVVVRVGSWTMYRQIDKEGRFPKVDQHIPSVKDALAGFRMAPTDAEFLANTLPSLPGDDECDRPITIDLNGSVAIRAKGANQNRPAELVLSNSTRSGEPIRFGTNRQFLARAVKLGFDEIHVYGPKVPVLCEDAYRSYVWALLGPACVIKPSDNVTRIASPTRSRAAQPTTTKPPRRKSTMSKPTTNGRANGNGRTQTPAIAKADDQGFEVLIEQAEAMRVSLRDSLSKTGELITALKRHCRQSKAVTATLASLRRLQGVAV